MQPLQGQLVRFQETGDLMPRHGRVSRREWASFIARGLGGAAAAGGLAAGEAIRVAETRATVAGGWGTGIAAGVGVGLALAVLLAVTVQVQRRRPRSGGKPQAILVIAIALLLLTAFFTSTPLRQIVPHPVPYVITSGIEVAEISYISTCTALLAVLLATLAVLAPVLDRRPPRAGQGSA